MAVRLYRIVGVVEPATLEVVEPLPLPGLGQRVTFEGVDHAAVGHHEQATTLVSGRQCPDRGQRSRHDVVVGLVPFGTFAALQETGELVVDLDAREPLPQPR